MAYHHAQRIAMRTYLHLSRDGQLYIVSLDATTFAIAKRLGLAAAQRRAPVAVQTNSPELPIVAARLMCPEGDWTARLTDWLARHTTLHPDEIFPSEFALNTPEAPTWAEIGESILVAALCGHDPAFARTAYFTVFDAVVDVAGDLWLDVEGYRLRIPSDVFGAPDAMPSRRAA
jgi:hypothetical protein